MGRREVHMLLLFSEKGMRRGIVSCEHKCIVDVSARSAQIWHEQIIWTPDIDMNKLFGHRLKTLYWGYNKGSISSGTVKC